MASVVEPFLLATISEITARALHNEMEMVGRGSSQIKELLSGNRPREAFRTARRGGAPGAGPARGDPSTCHVIVEQGHEGSGPGPANDCVRAAALGAAVPACSDAAAYEGCAQDVAKGLRRV